VTESEQKSKQRKILLDRLLEVIDRIEVYSEEKPNKFFFNEAAYATDILDFEVEYDISLPYFYKVFLNRINGGFISQIFVPDSSQIETASWNSINLFSLTEIEEAYSDLSLQSWKFLGPSTQVYPFIPFARTAIGEWLIFVNPGDKDIESPVFDAFHEEFPADWGSLYPDFSRFLDDYVKNEGCLKTISYNQPTAEEFLDKLSDEDKHRE